jgi:two-component system phosphate regulon sensor histidine kinase PhoR
LFVVQAIVLNLEIKTEREKFNKLADKVILDIHHRVEDDKMLSESLIRIIKDFESGDFPDKNLVQETLDKMKEGIDSICAMNGIFLNSDFVLYRVKDTAIVLDSREGRYMQGSFTEHTVKAGWRIREQLGKGNYRIGHVYHNKYVYLLREMGILLVLSLVLFILLIASVSYSLKSWKLHQDLSSQKNHFINNLTHELKTPIFSTSLLHSVIREKSRDADKVDMEKYLDMLEAENEKLKARVEKVLDIAQLDHGKIEMSKQIFDLHKLLGEQMESFKFLAEQRGGMVLAKLEAENSLVFGDPVHIGGVVINLVDNAIKYHKDVPRVEIETESDDNHFLLRIKDKGIGIPKSKRDFVFEKFSRIHTGDLHDVKGFGLGLSYVKMVLDQHDALIHLDSESGTGSIFEVKFNLADHEGTDIAG